MAPPSNVSSLMLLLNNAKYNAGMHQSAMATKALNDGVGALSKTLGTRLTATIGALALRRVAAKLRGFATDSIKAASDAREMGNQFNVVFSGIAASADRAFRKTADALGIADSTAKTLLGDTGNLLVGFQFTEKEALKLSQRAVKLAGDLTSLTNVQGGTARATKLLVSGMLGHSRALKTLKISVNLAEAATKKRIRQLMVEQNLTHAQARAVFVLNESIRQSPKALNDLKNTWNAYANTVRRVSESMKEVREIFGEMILKFSGLHPLVNVLSNGLKKVTDWWKSLGERTRKIVAIIALVAASIVILVGTFAGLTVILPFFVAGWAIALKFVAVVGLLTAGFASWLTIVNALTKAILNMPLGDIWKSFTNGAMRAGKFVVGFFANFKLNWTILTQWLQDNWGKMWENAAMFLGAVFTNMVANVSVIGERLVAVWSVITKHLAKTWEVDFTQTIIETFAKAINSLFSLAIAGAKSLVKGIKQALAGQLVGVIQANLSAAITKATGGGSKKGGSLLDDLTIALNKGDLKVLEGFKSTFTKFPGFFTFLGKFPGAAKKDEEDDPAKDLAKVLTQSTSQRLVTGAREGSAAAATIVAQNKQQVKQTDFLEKITDNTAETNKQLGELKFAPANL